MDIRTTGGLPSADEIAAVDGVDVLMIGTNDLCAEFGIPSEFAHDRIVESYERVTAAARKHNKWVGMGGVPTEEGMVRYIGMGAQFILSGADFSFMMTGAIARATALRRLEKSA